MSQILCKVEEILLPGDFTMIDSVRVTCSRCKHTAEAFGTGQPSVRRCFASLRQTCPEHEDNFYVDEDAEEKPRVPAKPGKKEPLLPKISLARSPR